MVLRIKCSDVVYFSSSRAESLPVVGVVHLCSFLERESPAHPTFGVRVPRDLATAALHDAREIGLGIQLVQGPIPPTGSITLMTQRNKHGKRWSENGTINQEEGGSAVLALPLYENPVNVFCRNDR